MFSLELSSSNLQNPLDDVNHLQNLLIRVHYFKGLRKIFNNLNLNKLVTVHRKSYIMSMNAATLEFFKKKNSRAMIREPGAAESGSKYANHVLCCPQHANHGAVLSPTPPPQQGSLGVVVDCVP